jgi:hypothetical protein
MPSTYDPLLRLELQATGENDNTWGDKTNTNLTLLGQAIAGHVSVAATGSGDLTLSTSNASTDEARRQIITLSGTITGNRSIIVPTASKTYVFRNNTTPSDPSYTITVKTASGTGTVLPASGFAFVICDGVNCYAVSDPNKLDLTGGAITGQIAVSVSTSVSASAALTITQSGAGAAIYLVSGQFGLKTDQPAADIHVSAGGIIADDIGAIGVSSTFTVWVSSSASGARAVFSGVSAPTNPGGVAIYGGSTTTPGILLSGASNAVGINTASPAYTLDVDGNARITGALTLGSAVMPVPDGTVPVYNIIRSWGTFGDGNYSFKRGQNIGSVVFNATGDITITFTSAMPNANYGLFVYSENNIGFTHSSARTEAKSPSSFRLQFVGWNGTTWVDMDPYAFYYMVVY